jgi:hypothetical protein
MVNVPPVAEVLRAATETAGSTKPTGIGAKLPIGRLFESLTERVARTWKAAPVAAVAAALALTRKLVMRSTRVPVPGGSMGTPTNVTELGADGMS